MERGKLQFAVVMAIGFVFLGAVGAAFRLGVASAEGGQVGRPLALSGTTSTLLQYQGRLSAPDSGEPAADGSYTMVLRLYNAPAGGSALWTEIKDVPVQDGLFSTVLGDQTALDRALFDGRALWLGVKVGNDEEAQPRQQLLPSAYALGLLPGAAVKADSGAPALSLSNSGGGQALYAGGPVEVTGDLTVAGKLNGATHVHSSHNNNPSAHHTRYTDAEAVSAALSSPNIVTHYEFDDHVYGGMHSGRALAYGSIRQDGVAASASGNVSSRWDNGWKCYEITIDGHTYNQQSYVTVVTPLIGIANAWALNDKLCVGVYDLDGLPMKTDFHFVTFQP